MGLVANISSLALANLSITVPVIGTLLIILLLLYLVGILRPFGNPSPFKRVNIREPVQFQADSAVRDKVLKRGFTAKKVPSDLDAIVIGSGISGLSTAAILSKCEKRVLVLEQHDQAGGCCHTFHDKSFEFDVGLHYVGNMGYGKDMRVLMDLLTDGQLQWEPLSPVFDEVLVNKRRFPLMKGHDNLKRYLLEQFPSEHDAIEKFIFVLRDLETCDWPFAILKFLPARLSRLLVKIGLIDRLSNIFQYSKITLRQYLDEITNNDLLKTVLGYAFGDAGVLPSEVSLYSYCCIVNHFLQSGAYYPHGGSSEIAYHLIPTIQKCGGDVLVRARVVKLLDDGVGRVVGVRVQKSTGSDPVDIYANTVVSAAGLLNTKKMLDSKITTKSEYFSRISDLNLRPGVAGISVFVGLNAPNEELNLPKSNCWIFSSTNMDEKAEEYMSLSREEAATSEVPLVFLGFPSAKDPTWRIKNPSKSTATAITLVNYDWFSDWEDTRLGKRGENYEEFKASLGEMVWTKCLEYFPQLEGKVEYLEVGSPLTNNYYIGSQQGELYGLHHGLSRVQPDGVIDLRPETDIPGLFITGQDIFTCGFAGGLFSGLMSSSAILGRNILVDILVYKFTRYLKEQYYRRIAKTRQEGGGML